ncbi:RDD family protein [Flavobacterium sp. ALJ2]|uniref:RDD family protein n=1 Tax=Flavobacterium sp. ALJ2 TaxID=2786960 RepID=UPI00189F41F0|nr:RDD family protein [Flavobacterium sp. ALJ2]MBF7091543.1 RDD family protein [Flavobacterium sp. ALJ2]
MSVKYPTILDRTKSTLIDTILLIACMYIFTDILTNFSTIPNWVKVTLFVSLLMYEPICTTFGATIGNHKNNIRVRKISDTSKRLNIFQSIIRYFFKLIFGWFSFITIFMNPKSRSIHDLISGSVMIKID